VVLPELQFLSTYDIGSIDTFTVCRRVVAEDYPSTFFLKPELVARVLEWLSKL
jgi:hypothetical protein